MGKAWETQEKWRFQWENHGLIIDINVILTPRYPSNNGIIVR